MMRRISTFLIIAGILIAMYPLYEQAYTYYWENKLVGDLTSLDEIYSESDKDYTRPDDSAVLPSDGTQTDEPVVNQPGEPAVKPSKPAGTTNAVVPKETKPEVRSRTMGILSISKIALRLPVIEGITKTNMKRGVAWMEGSGRLGKNGNAVIAGHRGYTHGRLFNRLNEIKVNDTFDIQTKNATYSYKVYEVKIVKPSDISVLSQPRSKEIVTLITCTPLYKSTHRIIIKAVRTN